MGREVRIIAIGDVHYAWDGSDQKFVENYSPDLILGVGDYGEEDPGIIKRVAALGRLFPFATNLGNHDAIDSHSDMISGKIVPPPNSRVEEIIRQLGGSYVGYSFKNFEQFDLSVVGGRPFSWGGGGFDYGERALVAYFHGVSSAKEGTERIVENVKYSSGTNIIMLSHCGPYGLGREKRSPCGMDWTSAGGDGGDHDLKDAMDKASRLAGKNILLSVFGHHHSPVKNSRGYPLDRKAVALDKNATLNVNCAYVRHVKAKDFPGHVRYLTEIILEKDDVGKYAVKWVARLSYDDQATLLKRRLLWGKSALVAGDEPEV